MNALTMSLLQRPHRCANLHRPAPVQSGPVGVQRSIVGSGPTEFLPIIQAKLRIGAPNDRYEQEANRVADQVMRMPEQEPAMIDGLHGPETVQRTCAACTGCRRALPGMR